MSWHRSGVHDGSLGALYLVLAQTFKNGFLSFSSFIHEGEERNEETLGTPGNLRVGAHVGTSPGDTQLGGWTLESREAGGEVNGCQK